MEMNPKMTLFASKEHLVSAQGKKKQDFSVRFPSIPFCTRHERSLVHRCTANVQTSLLEHRLPARMI